MNKRIPEPEVRIQTVGISLDGDTKAKLDAIASEQQRSRSQVVRMAVAAYAKESN